ncbi:amidase signature domain-containing protein [Podospora didyma]|uniref:Amidase signature domain-containing protein n=1 Tax=Podospora didyma TaxID=330526 RepID=A0AAE0KDV6_9PEZI|nr:amidase signature domain-containing protein [Podospora didyma]
MAGFVAAPLPSLAKIAIDDIGRGLGENSFTVVDLVAAHLARIEEVNGVFNAVIDVNPDALTIVEGLDKEMSAAEEANLHRRPYEHLVRVVRPPRFPPPAEAFVITRLRRAGAIILGKTNLSEFCDFRSTGATNGWSPRGGQTYGAFVPGQAPEGSSSGSAVSMALGLAPASVGMERNNIVGFRPTTDLVPRDGIIPVSDRLDTVGPMARTWRTRPQWHPYGSSSQSHGVYQPHDYGKIRSGSKTLASLGATVVDNVEIPSQDEWDAWELDEKMRTLIAEFKASINRWCQRLVVNPRNITSLDDLIEFVRNDFREAIPREISIDSLPLRHHRALTTRLPKPP